MRSYRVLTALLVVGIFVAPPASAQNLVTNGSFNSGLSGWSESTSTGYYQWESSQSRSGGGGSAWLYGIDSSTTVELVQCVSSIAPGATYRLSGSMYFTLFDNDGVGQGIIGFRGYAGSFCSGGVTVDRSDSRGSGSTNQWFDHGTGEVTTSPSTQSIQVYARVTTPGGTFVSAYFDDMNLEETAPPQPTSRVDILGPTDAQPGDARYFAAVGTDCSGPTDFGWTWNASGAQIASHPTRERVLIRFSSAGTFSITASHPNCGSTVGSHTTSVSTTGARVGVMGLPYMYQPDGTDLGRSAYGVRNWGDEATTITLDQSGDFFTQDPASFTLQPGESREISLAGVVKPLGLYQGRSLLLGDGVPSALDQGILVRLFVFDPDNPYGQAEPLENRIDTTDPGQLIIPFQNSDPFSDVIGYIVSDVPWIVPPDGTVTIPAGGSADVTVTVDRSMRPDAASPLGSVFGSVLFTTPFVGSSKFGEVLPQATTNASTSLVTVVDTAPPSSALAGIPGLGGDEVALFVPGVGHVVGSVGTFISDLSVVNHDFFSPINTLDLYFNPVPGSAGPASQKSTVSSVPATGSLVLADLVSTVYGQEAQLGSLQIRSPRIENLGVTATVFNKSDPAGTFGTTIPVFRSDRDATPGEEIYLTGLTRSTSRHTNLFLQETSGATVTVSTRFLGESGNTLGTRTDEVGPFSMIQIGNVVPEGAVSAVLRNDGDTGEFAAYATPVDELSGDTWAVSDWPRQLGYTRAESVVIPVVGALHGANDTFFRTDVTILSTGSISARGTLRYFDRTGPVYEEDVDIDPMNTLVLDNITETLFQISGDTVGHMTYSPVSGEAVITSRNFTTVAGGEATFGSGVPTLALASSLSAGEIAQFAGVSDASLETIQDELPATFRTNFGLVETAGEPTTIRVVVRFSIPQTTSNAIVEASKNYDLAPNQFLLLGNLVRTILGAESQELIGDVNNVEVRFEHIGGTGRAAVFTSSVDNGTGDSILRVE